MAPNLAIEYDSAEGSGLLGKGWFLSGLSRIDRCERTVAQDGAGGTINYDANDRFCMDGHRLVAISGAYGGDGTEYRTESESFSKIVSYGISGNGPAWFKAWTKNGQIVEFGNTADSRIEAQGKTTVRTWATNRVQDRKGTYLTVSYVENGSSGEFYPNRIDYSGNVNTGVAPYNSVQFVYQGRTDIGTRYRGGSMVKSTVRLANLRTYNGANLVQDYRLAYQNTGAPGWTRLTSVQQCDAAGACLAPTSFAWTDAGVPTLVAGTKQDTGVPFYDFSPLGPLVLDFNGDGKSDLVYLRNDATGNMTLVPATFNGSGFTFGASYNPGLKFDSAQIDYYGPNMQVADLNGDGKNDLVYYQVDIVNINGQATSVLRLRSLISNGTGFTLGPVFDTGQQVGTYEGGVPFFLPLDIDGDGRTDFVQERRNSDGSLSLMSIFPNGDSFRLDPWVATGQSYSTTGYDQYNPTYFGPGFIAGDFNGDHKDDLLQRWNNNGILYIRPWYSDGRTFAPGAWVNTGVTYTPASVQNDTTPPKILAVDFNNDGLVDVVVSTRTPGTTETVLITPFLSTGNGFAQLATINPGQLFPLPSGAKASELMPLDINGDGRIDLVQSWSSPSQLLLQPLIANGTSFTAQNWFNTYQFFNTTSNPYGNSSGPHLLAMDMNGDGKGDLLQQFVDGGDTFSLTWRILPYLSGGAVGDLVKGINNGISGDITIDYKPLTDAAVYTKDTGAVYPVADEQYPYYVVANASVSNGIGGSVSTTYQYGGMKKDLNGRGSLGFRWIKSQNAQTGMTELTNYLQSWPFTGLVSTQQKSLAGKGNGGTLSQRTVQYQCSDFVTAAGCSAAPGRRYLALVSQNELRQWDLNGTVMPTVTTTTFYDGNTAVGWSDLNAIYGNPTKVTTSASDGYSSTVVNAYTNDVANWLLGRLDTATTTNTTP
jgi:hypothetical protein